MSLVLYYGRTDRNRQHFRELHGSDIFKTIKLCLQDCKMQRVKLFISMGNIKEPSWQDSKVTSELSGNSFKGKSKTTVP